MSHLGEIDFLRRIIVPSLLPISRDLPKPPEAREKGILGLFTLTNIVRDIKYEINVCEICKSRFDYLEFSIVLS